MVGGFGQVLLSRRDGDAGRLSSRELLPGWNNVGNSVPVPERNVRGSNQPRQRHDVQHMHSRSVSRKADTAEWSGRTRACVKLSLHSKPRIPRSGRLWRRVNHIELVHSTESQANQVTHAAHNPTNDKVSYALEQQHQPRYFTTHPNLPQPPRDIKF